MMLPTEDCYSYWGLISMAIHKYEFSASEKKTRIRLLVATYCYEVLDNPVISDAKWDELAKLVDLNATTDNEGLDQWFKEHFSPHTGQWIYKLPPDYLERIRTLAKQLTAIN